MSLPEDDAEAPTLAVNTPGTLPDRSSRPVMIEDGLTPGDEIGRYRLKARLGAGAMGVVWLARDPQLDRDVAIKVVHPALSRTQEASSRLLREARAMAKLSHRSVITVHDAGEVDGRLFLAMELVQGKTLGSILRARDATSIANWRRWLGVMLDAGRGLAEAHRHGVLHRDFKPDNVLVDDSGRVCRRFRARDARRGDCRGRRERAVEHGDGARSDDPGALLGTLVYIRPDRRSGANAWLRSDAFHSCGDGGFTSGRGPARTDSETIELRDTSFKGRPEHPVRWPYSASDKCRTDLALVISNDGAPPVGTPVLEAERKQQANRRRLTVQPILVS